MKKILYMKFFGIILRVTMLRFDFHHPVHGFFIVRLISIHTYLDVSIMTDLNEFDADCAQITLCRDKFVSPVIRWSKIHIKPVIQIRTHMYELKSVSR